MIQADGNANVPEPARPPIKLEEVKTVSCTQKFCDEKQRESNLCMFRNQPPTTPVELQEKHSWSDKQWMEWRNNEIVLVLEFDRTHYVSECIVTIHLRLATDPTLTMIG